MVTFWRYPTPPLGLEGQRLKHTYFGLSAWASLELPWNFDRRSVHAFPRAAQGHHKKTGVSLADNFGDMHI